MRFSIIGPWWFSGCQLLRLGNYSLPWATCRGSGKRAGKLVCFRNGLEVLALRLSYAICQVLTILSHLDGMRERIFAVHHLELSWFRSEARNALRGSTLTQALLLHG